MSRTTRRTVEVSAHMPEQALPRVQHRQWVPSVPKRVRLHLRHKPEVLVAAGVFSTGDDGDAAVAGAGPLLGAAAGAGLRTPSPEMPEVRRADAHHRLRAGPTGDRADVNCFAIPPAAMTQAHRRTDWGRGRGAANSALHEPETAVRPSAGAGWLTSGAGVGDTQRTSRGVSGRLRREWWLDLVIP